MIYLIKPTSPSPFRELASNENAVIAPNQDTLNHSTPEQTQVNEILKDFPFDDSKVVSLNEAQRIMEWLGANQMTLFTRTADPHLSGYLPTGCLFTIWVGNYGERDTYRLRASCEDTSAPDFEPYYLTISKPKKTVAWEYFFDDPSLATL